MEVTDLKYNLENKLVERMDAFARMVTRKKQIQDVLFTVHGKTGSGKTNTELVLAYYLKYKTNRDIYLFFSTEQATEFAKINKDKIILIDEPSLDSLSKDQMTKINKNFMRLLNTMRQKRHIVIVAITRFWRFPFDLVVDRSLAMINMYNKDGKDSGRFHYIRQRRLEQLWNDYQKFKKKNFGKLKAFGGWIPERMEKLDENGQYYFNRMGIIINGKQNCTYDDYKEFRDKEVAGIGETEKKSKKEIAAEIKLKELRYKISQISNSKLVNREQLASLLGIASIRLREWSNIGLNQSISLGKQGFKGFVDPDIINTMGDEQKNNQWDDGEGQTKAEGTIIKGETA